MLDENKVRLYIGLSSMVETLILWVITLPKCTGGAPLVLLVPHLGTEDCGGVPETLDALEVSRD